MAKYLDAGLFGYWGYLGALVSYRSSFFGICSLALSWVSVAACSVVRSFMKYLCSNFIYNFFGYLLLAIYAFVMHFSFLVFGQFLHSDLLVLVWGCVWCVCIVCVWMNASGGPLICDMYTLSILK